IAPEPPPVTPAPAAHNPAAHNGHSRHAAREMDSDDAIYQKMLSEWLVDPHELSHSTDLNWQSVWDHGWSAAAAAESAPVLDHTVEGLPVRRPGARLVPGAADDGNHRNGAGQQAPSAAGVAESGGGAHGRHVRDPEAVRTSIGRHFGGVHAARSRTQQTEGADTE
ncbi:MAG: ATP-binding protein, partial [Mycobacterium sp.]|nr:ATP-binding protein [Mycobacterium sp.]